MESGIFAMPPDGLLPAHFNSITLISILIPVFQTDVTMLVNELIRQCRLLPGHWEIICFQDGFDAQIQETNEGLCRIPGVVYEILPQNVGRAAVRNLLARKANFPYLLFMDCDSGIVRPNYVWTYFSQLQPATVLCGGRVYQDNPPQDKRFMLHWKFGRSREQIPTKLRAKQPHRAFMSNNFVVPRDCFLDIQMDERLSGYGHEDTLFGMELLARRIPVLHLDNPIEHLGLETAGVLIQKNNEAMRNLAWLVQHASIPIKTRLVDLVLKLKQYRLDSICAGFLFRIAPFLHMLLHIKNPPLWVLDAYKLERLFWWLASGRLSSHKANHRG